MSRSNNSQQLTPPPSPLRHFLATPHNLQEYERAAVYTRDAPYPHRPVAREPSTRSPPPHHNHSNAHHGYVSPQQIPGSPVSPPVSPQSQVGRGNSSASSTSTDDADGISIQELCEQLFQRYGVRVRIPGSRGEFVWKCKKCGPEAEESYGRSHDLKRHIRSDHLRVTFQCHCGTVCSRSDTLYRHQKKQHPAELAKSNKCSSG